MAVDEAMLEGVDGGVSPATLRFSGWCEPTISLGYFQKYAEFLNQDEVIRRMPLVRRITGGGAILHDDELTYSLVLPTGGKEKIEIENLYRLMHDAFIEVLAGWSVPVAYRGEIDGKGDNAGGTPAVRSNMRRGPFFCFARHYRLDLVIEEKKLLGSAQRRLKNAVLQHGSLILGRRFQQQQAAELKAAAGERFELKQLIDQMAALVSSRLKLQPVEGRLSDEEHRRSMMLEKKYAGETWNRRR